MSNQEAYDYLAETVADYVHNRFPLQYLCGEEGNGKPDSKHMEKLKDALAKLGFAVAASKVK